MVNGMKIDGSSTSLRFLIPASAESSKMVSSLDGVLITLKKIPFI
jgi:hypothetical protein